MLSFDSEAATERNRRLWDDWTRGRASSSFDDIETFRSGGATLSAFERSAIGAVDGRRVVHLQCHIGLGTLTLARAGAKITGVDFSAESIAVARRLAEEASLAARFVHADLYRLPGILSERFDLVYAGRGALCWLPDIQAWAHVVAHMLDPGGRLVLFDSHPTAQMFDEDRPITAPRVRYPYASPPEGELIPVDDTPADRSGTDSVAVFHQWSHPLGAIVTALAEAGLTLDVLEEHGFSFWQAFPDLRPDPDDPRLWRPPSSGYGIPLTFTLRATR